MEPTTYGRRWDANDVNKLADCLKRLPPQKRNNNPPRYTTSALKLLDCVLSLNRKYEEFVVPLVDGFKNNHPNVNTLSDLHNFIISSGGPTQFFENVLGYNDAQRADTLAGVLLTFLNNILPHYAGTSELDRFRKWAISVQPRDYTRVEVYGFGLAGWQYLRMLFGADTCKPDRHINRFVKECLGRRVSRLSVVELMESSAPRAGLSVREADRRIWSQKRMGNSGCR